MTRVTKSALALIVMVLAGGAAFRAHAGHSYDNCAGFIDSVPVTIATQGTWCLRKDLTTAQSTGAAIVVQANNVTIDCNDFKLGGLPAGLSSDARGIETQGAQLNLTVRHCGIRGFGIGIYTASGAGHLIEDNRLDQNRISAIQLNGDGVIVRRNRVIDTGGRPNVTATTAIGVSGAGTTIEDNLISGVLTTGVAGNGSTNGINLGEGPHRVTGNFVQGMVPLGTGLARGIWGDTQPMYAIGNTIVSPAPVNGTGIQGISSKSVCRDNIVTNFVEGFTLCADAGGNTVN